MEKEKREDRQIEEIFRKKLEAVEISPGSAVLSRIMHKLAVSEFLHFNPLRFNVYYLGTMVVFASVATMIFYGGYMNHEKKNETVPLTGRELKDSLVIFSHESAKAGLLGKSSGTGQYSDQAHEKKITAPLPKVVVETRKAMIGREMDENKTGRITGPFIPKQIFSRKADADSRLIDREERTGSLIDLSPGSGCAPLKVRFDCSTSDADSCVWNFGNGVTSSVKKQEIIYSSEGLYRVSLVVFRINGDKIADSATVSVMQPPIARFEISLDGDVKPGEEVVHFRNFSSGAMRYLWQFGDGDMSELFEPVHHYKSYGNFEVILGAFSQEGCTDTSVVEHVLAGSGYFIEFPNAFIPNEGGPSGGRYSAKSDESAQVFHPSNAGVSEYNLMVYSKMGVMVFESNDINLGWDGYFKGQLCNPGVYVWKVRGKFVNGEPFSHIGDLTLLKN